MEGLPEKGTQSSCGQGASSKTLYRWREGTGISVRTQGAHQLTSMGMVPQILVETLTQNLGADLGDSSYDEVVPSRMGPQFKV